MSEPLVWQPVTGPGMTLAEQVRRTCDWIDQCLSRTRRPTAASALVAAEVQVEHLIDACEAAVTAGASWTDLAEAVNIPEDVLRRLLSAQS